ncbi:kinase-like domain-containing protein [Rhizophagus irregularis DAOM 181602=DAOM 197198]|nr:kinase-like domain-containing protein [Rhizophagus irregularis DAOM 181602=DAOM 197198]
MLNILMKEDLNLNENLNEFLKEWKYHTSVSSSDDIIFFYGFTEDPNISKYMVVMDYANKDLMKKCWNEDSSKRPSSKEVKKLNEMIASEDLSGCMVNLKSLDIKTDEN